MIDGRTLRRAAPGPSAITRRPGRRPTPFPAHEQRAVDNAVDKLAAFGPLLAFPHSSNVMGDPGGALRELRPRAGRSPWRCIYQRIGDVFLVAAVAPEA